MGATGFFRVRMVLGGLCLLSMLEVSAQLPQLGPGVPAFTVRPGYRVDRIADQIGEVRFIEFGEPGILYVSQPRTGAIITLQQRAGVWRKIGTFVSDRPTAHGMHYVNGWLWFTQSGAVWKARDTDGDGEADDIQLVTDDLPSGGGHWWRSIVVTPDAFYTSIGDSHNIGDELDSERQKIWRFNLDGSGKRLFASGLRNTEKLRIRPGTDEVWGADHGSDRYGQLLGEERGLQPFTDKLPPEEFNHYIDGGFYGHPVIVGPGLPRLEFKDRPDFIELAAKTIHPAWCMGAHWAPNGWTFAATDALGLQGDALIACHGSWNSTVRVGYCVNRLMFDAVTDSLYGSQVLVSCITADQQVLARPCDVAEAPDGSLFFSDDANGRIYRIARSTETSRPARPTGSAAAGSATDSAAGAFGALDYFQVRCASCHGNYGRAYGAEFARGLSEEELEQIVLEMTEGPAGAPLNGEPLRELNEVHRALRDGRPYAAVTGRSADGLVRGEALPGSRLTLEIGDLHQPVPLQGHTWEIRLPAGVDAETAALRVHRNGKEIVLPLTPETKR